jgi:hypothetical protein
MWFVGEIESGFVVKSARGLTIGGVQYPRNIFTRWSKEELSDIGILPYREVGINSKYQWQGELAREIVDGEVVGTYAGIDRDIDSLKSNMVSQVESLTSSKLAKSDWMSIREFDGGTEMSADMKTYRSDVRADSNRKEAEIDALTDMDAIKAYENHPVTITSKTKHTSEEGVETWGEPLITTDSEVSRVTTHGWSIDPMRDVNPYFVEMVDRG